MDGWFPRSRSRPGAGACSRHRATAARPDPGDAGRGARASRWPHPATLRELVQLRTGGSYEVDSASLVMALLAGPSQQGAWSAVVGVDDFGAEAAAEMGVDLSRTVLVPDVGDLWLEATTALIDVVTMVVLRPPPVVDHRVAGRVAARLRKRSAVLVAWGRWPRCRGVALVARVDLGRDRPGPRAAAHSSSRGRRTPRVGAVRPCCAVAAGTGLPDRTGGCAAPLEEALA